MITLVIGSNAVGSDGYRGVVLAEQSGEILPAGVAGRIQRDVVHSPEKALQAGRVEMLGGNVLADRRLDRGRVGLVAHRGTRAAEDACVAREQCVFTLPSEHPITLAVSLTSSSSQ